MTRTDDNPPRPPRPRPPRDPRDRQRAEPEAHPLDWPRLLAVAARLGVPVVRGRDHRDNVAIVIRSLDDVDDTRPPQDHIVTYDIPDEVADWQAERNERDGITDRSTYFSTEPQALTIDGNVSPLKHAINCGLPLLSIWLPETDRYATAAAHLPRRPSPDPRRPAAAPRARRPRRRHDTTRPLPPVSCNTQLTRPDAGGQLAFGKHQQAEPAPPGGGGSTTPAQRREPAPLRLAHPREVMRTRHLALDLPAVRNLLAGRARGGLLLRLLWAAAGRRVLVASGALPAAQRGAVCPCAALGPPRGCGHTRGTPRGPWRCRGASYSNA